MCLAASSCHEPMLAACPDVVIIKVFQNTSMDMFLDLTAYASQGNWSIITQLVLFTFLEYGCDIDTPPVFRYSFCIEALQTYCGIWCNVMGHTFRILAGSRSGRKASAGLIFSSSLTTPCWVTLIYPWMEKMCRQELGCHLCLYLSMLIHTSGLRCQPFFGVMT